MRAVQFEEKLYSDKNKAGWIEIFMVLKLFYAVRQD